MKELRFSSRCWLCSQYLAPVSYVFTSWWWLLALLIRLIWTTGKSISLCLVSCFGLWRILFHKQKSGASLLSGRLDGQCPKVSNQILKKFLNVNLFFFFQKVFCKTIWLVISSITTKSNVLVEGRGAWHAEVHGVA